MKVSRLVFYSLLVFSLLLPLPASASTTGLVPPMTSNTAPSGVASASSELNWGGQIYYAYRAFGGTSSWASANQIPAWIQYRFPEAQIVNKVRFRAASWSFAPNSVQVQASNNGTNFSTLLTRSLNMASYDANDGNYATLTFDNSTPYTHYRLYFSGTISGGNHFDIVDIQYLETGAPQTPHGLTSSLSNGSTTLLWSAVSDSDLVGYNVYRDGVKVNEDPLTETSFTSATDNRVSYSWYVTSVDSSGNESEPSTVLTTEYDTTVRRVNKGINTIDSKSILVNYGRSRDLDIASILPYFYGGYAGGS